jgi:immunity protein 5 of polymorphic toxin system
MSLDDFDEDHRLLVLWAAHCAEHGLPRFEEEYPEDDRACRTIEPAGRSRRSVGARRDLGDEARAAAFAAHAAAG